MGKRDAVVYERMNRPLAVGQRVRVLTNPAEEGMIRRIVPHYNVVTVIIEVKAGKSERMVRAQDVELLGAEST